MTLRDIANVYHGIVSITVNGYYKRKRDNKTQYFSFYTMYHREDSTKVWEEMATQNSGDGDERLDYKVVDMFAAGNCLYITIADYTLVEELPEED